MYKHPGGLREERAHLLSTSDGADYNSGDSGVSTSTLPRPIQAARSAGLQLVAQMDPKEDVDLKGPKDKDPDSHSFMDLTDTDE